MDRTDAERLALMLLTAFASPKVKPADTELWTAFLGELGDAELAQEVITGLIRDQAEGSRPLVGRVTRDYRVASRRRQEAEERAKAIEESTVVEPSPAEARKVLAAIGDADGWFAEEARRVFRPLAGLAPKPTDP